MLNRLIPLLLFTAIACLVLRAAEVGKPSAESVRVKLAAGADAPALSPEKWLQGEPVSAFEKNKLYVIECWATWCGPCLASIPHLNELHAKFKDRGVVIIGIDVMENTERKVAGFVSAKGTNMAYHIAYDGKSGQVSENWLKAAGVSGIPHAFVVREGKLLWHGHPATLTEENVQAMLAGKFDSAKQAAKESAENARIVKYRLARLEILQLIRDHNSTKALAKVDEYASTLVDTDPADPHLLRGIIYSANGDRELAMANYQKAAAAAHQDASASFRVAYALLNQGTVRDTKLALECARRAAELKPERFFQNTLAQAEYAAGNQAAAQAILEKLVASPDGDLLKPALEAVKSGAPWPTQDRL